MGNSIEIKNCEGVGGKRLIATGGVAILTVGIIIGVVGTLYYINKMNKKDAETLASTVSDVVTILKAA